MAVDDRFGQAGGAGGKQDPQRVFVPHTFVTELLARDRLAFGQFLPGDQLAATRIGELDAAEIVEPDDRIEARKPADDLLYLPHARKVLAAEAVAVGCE